jgi:hypothetical protein
MAIRKGEWRVARDYEPMPNAWARDPRLSLEAAGLLWYICSHRFDFTMTEAQLMRAKKVGRDKLRRIKNELYALGYLHKQSIRDEAGAFTGEIDWIVQDPADVAERARLAALDLDQPNGGKHAQRADSGRFSRPTENPSVGDESVANDRMTGNPSVGDDPVDNSRMTGNPSVGDDPVDNSRMTENPSVGESANSGASEGDRRTGIQTTGFPSVLKEDDLLRRFNPPSSSVPEVPTEAQARSEADDDPEVVIDRVARAVLSGLDPRLDIDDLRERLYAGRIVAVEDLDIAAAVTEIWSRRSGPVANPIAFVAASIERTPTSWQRSQRPSSNARTNVGLCATAGHKFFDDYDFCVRCDSPRAAATAIAS